LILSRTRLTNADNIDSRLSLDRTFGFAYPAPDAEIEINVRLFQQHLASIPVPRLGLLEPDSLLRSRADLFAHYAWLGLCIWQASAFIDHGKPDLHLHFFFERKPPDGAGRAYLSAKGATVLTITYARYEYRRPDAFQSRLKECRLEPVGWADPHAFAAFNASFEKFAFFQ
jgi:hypothetical protein